MIVSLLQQKKLACYPANTKIHLKNSEPHLQFISLPGNHQQMGKFSRPVL